MNSINTLMDLMQIQCDDSLRNNTAVINFIKDLFSSCKDVKVLSTEGSNNKSILIGVNTPLDSCNEGILFSGRMSHTQSFYNDRHAYIKEGSIYGPGIICFKYFTACLYQAIPRLKESHRPIIIALPFVDQSGITGSKSIIQYMKDRSIHPNLCIQVGPTNFSFITGNDGCYEYRMKIYCNGGHASLSKVLASPFYLASKFISQIQDLNQSQNKGIVNIALIEGGRAMNQIPRQCTICYGVRTASLDFKQMVDKLVEGLKQEANGIGNGMSLENIALDNSVPLFNNNDSRWIKYLSSISATKKPLLHMITEAGFYQEVGIDTLIFGAGDIRDAHTEREHIAISELKKYTEAICSIVNLYNEQMAAVI